MPELPEVESLAAYLRAMGSKVPAIYGGSADEPMAGA